MYLAKLENGRKSVYEKICLKTSVGREVMCIAETFSILPLGGAKVKNFLSLLMGV